MASHMMRVTLHVNDHGLVVSAGFDWYDRDGEHVGTLALGEFSEPQAPEQAFDYVWSWYLDTGQVQRPLF
jgi:hypothetical protein